MDAYTYVSQMNQSGFIQPMLTITMLNNNIKQFIELETSTIYYLINDVPPSSTLTNTTYNFFLTNNNFFLCLSPKGKSYFFVQSLVDSQWVWGSSSGASYQNTLYLIYIQRWTSLKTPFQKTWSLYQIIYNIPSAIQQSYLDANQTYIISLFEENQGQRVSDHSLLPLFLFWT